MFSRLPVASRALPAGLVLALGLLFAAGATAQTIDDRDEGFNKKDNKEVKSLRNRLFKGEEPADGNNKAQLDALDVGAKRVTYRYYWREYTNPTAPGKLHTVFEDLEKDLTTLAVPKNRANNGVATRLYCQQVMVRAREVFFKEQEEEKPRPITLINVTRAVARLVDRGIAQNEKEWADEVLPRVQGANSEQLATLFLELLKAPKNNDGVRYHALRGLANLLAVPPQTPDLLKDGRDKVVLEVLAFAKTLNARKFPAAATHAEKEGFKVLRREAVRVVARYPSPFLGEKEHPALFLAQIAGKDKSLNLEPRLDERLEASIGLARMKATGPRAPGYHPDYAAEQIGKFVRDFATVAAREVEAKGSSRSRPWKVEAARMADALDALRADVKTEYVRQFAEKTKAVLVRIEKGVAPGDAEYGDWLLTNLSPQRKLYRDVEGSTIEKKDKEPGDG